jgi:hypothetical protein
MLEAEEEKKEGSVHHKAIMNGEAHALQAERREIVDGNWVRFTVTRKSAS